MRKHGVKISRFSYLSGIADQLLWRTCHWCHVMENESFEDEDVSALLNKHFVSIKVDREERPDIDSVYMKVCHYMTGSGGWPLTIFMDARQLPFFAGTYFPKTSLMGHIGFVNLLENITDIWTNERSRINNAKEKIIEVLAAETTRAVPFDKKSHQTFGSDSQGLISEKWVKEAADSLKKVFDTTYGGFGDAPKFPSPHNLMLLLRIYAEHGDGESLNIVKKTLDCMADGGIYDHIGYGFCRYATDRRWLIPHFEKMLYDNALLAITYAECFSATGEEKYGKTARNILHYVTRDMLSGEGGFYSAEDADSEGEEGKFYVWDKKEVIAVLKGDGERFCRMYNITEAGNFEGKSIPNLINNSADEAFADECIKKLFDYRKNRVHPLKDTKILTSWNGMMICAFAKCAKVFADESYAKIAERAAVFILNNLCDETRLYTRYRDGHVLKKSFADDYAYVIWGLIELYETSLNEYYLTNAVNLMNTFLDDFYDSDGGGVFLYPKGQTQLITRPKEIYDGAVPSSNSVTAYNLIKLARIIGDYKYEQTAEKIIGRFAEEIGAYPAAYTFSAISVLYLYAKAPEVRIAAKNKNEASEALSFLSKRFLPYLTVVPVFEDTMKETNYAIPEKGWVAYVCINKSCSKGINNLSELERTLFMR